MKNKGSEHEKKDKLDEELDEFFAWLDSLSDEEYEALMEEDHFVGTQKNLKQQAKAVYMLHLFDRMHDMNPFAASSTGALTNEDEDWHGTLILPFASAFTDEMKTLLAEMIVVADEVRFFSGYDKDRDMKTRIRFCVRGIWSR